MAESPKNDEAKVEPDKGDELLKRMLRTPPKPKKAKGDARPQRSADMRVAQTSPDTKRPS